MFYYFCLQGDFAAAASNLQICLSTLGRALPTSRFDLICSLSWNIIRYSLQKLGLVRWLLKRTSQQRRATETPLGFEDEAKTSARDAALAYHKLHQLHITGRLKKINCGLKGKDSLRLSLIPDACLLHVVFFAK